MPPGPLGTRKTKVGESEKDEFKFEAQGCTTRYVRSEKVLVVVSAKPLFWGEGTKTPRGE